MLVTIMLMAGGSLLIAVLPTYSVVGWLAPILLLLARIAQGISLGGEVSNASAYLAEIAPPNRRGRYSSFFYISTGTALLAASLLGLLLTTTLSRPSWRRTAGASRSLVGGVLGIVGLYLRRTLAETEQFAENVDKAKATKNPLLKTLPHHPRSVLQLFGFTLLSTLCYYTFFCALTPFAVQSATPPTTRRVPGAVDRHGVFIGPVPLRRSGRQVRPQATDAGVVGRVRRSSSCR